MKIRGYVVGMAEKTYIVLYDGVCNLCNGWVRFIQKRDRHRRFSFVPLQQVNPHNAAEPYSTVILQYHHRQFEKSDAAIRILEGLGGIWRAARILRWVPRRVRDGVYDWVAAHRHRWFGTSNTCDYRKIE